MRRVDPRTLKRREVNARYMVPAQFQRLVENIRTDGKLTATVLVFLRDDGELEILSGHHRSEAAIEAGLSEIDVEVILTPIPEARRRAIQLSHNAISGKDDPALLAALWEGLDLDAKKFSGLTDDDIGGFNDLKLGAIGGVGPRYEEISLLFLPEDREVFDQMLKAFEGRKSKLQVLAGRVQDFDRFFEAVVATKGKLKIVNSAMAILAMAELALQKLAEMPDEDEQEPSAASAPKTKKGKRAA